MEKQVGNALVQKSDGAIMPQAPGHKSGQAALDFMMTYGWALLIIALVVSTILTLNIFDLNMFVGNRASGFAQIGVEAWRVTPQGEFTLMVRNSAGTDVNITQINATLERGNISYSTPVPILNGERSSAITVGTFPAQMNLGTGYNLKVNIAYLDTATMLTYIDSGMIYGKIA